MTGKQGLFLRLLSSQQTVWLQGQTVGWPGDGIIIHWIVLLVFSCISGSGVYKLWVLIPGNVVSFMGTWSLLHAGACPCRSFRSSRCLSYAWQSPVVFFEKFWTAWNVKDLLLLMLLRGGKKCLINDNNKNDDDKSECRQCLVSY